MGPSSCSKKKKMKEGGRVKKTNELTGEAKERARKTFAGEEKGLAGRLSNFMKGIKERRAETDKKMSDRAKAKRDQAKGKTAVPRTMKGQQVDTTISPYIKPKQKRDNSLKIEDENLKKLVERNKRNPKKEEVKTYQDAKLNKSNAPMPNFTPKKVDKMDAPKKEMTMMEKAKDIIGVGREATEKEKMGRALQDNARKSMGMKKGGKVYCKDGCAVRGKTKGKLY